MAKWQNGDMRNWQNDSRKCLSISKSHLCDIRLIVDPCLGVSPEVPTVIVQIKPFIYPSDASAPS